MITRKTYHFKLRYTYGEKFRFLDHYLKSANYARVLVLKQEKTEDFFNKVQNMGKIPQDSILVTADVVGLYPSIPHNAGLDALKDVLDCM